MDRLYVGIDNGLDGAMTLMTLRGEVIDQFVMPVVKHSKIWHGEFDKKGKQKYKRWRIVDETAIKAYFDKGDLWKQITAIIEKPAGSKDVKSAISMADSFATVRTTFRCHGVSPYEVRARVWQKTFWHRPQKDEKDVKQYALEKANELWPSYNWLASSRCTTPHDGLVDSALITEYARHNIL